MAVDSAVVGSVAVVVGADASKDFFGAAVVAAPATTGEKASGALASNPNTRQTFYQLTVTLNGLLVAFATSDVLLKIL